MQRSAKIQHQEDTKGTREVHKVHMRRLQQQALSPMGVATQSIPVRNGSLLCADAFSLRAGKHRAEKLLNIFEHPPDVLTDNGACWSPENL